MASPRNSSVLTLIIVTLVLLVSCGNAQLTQNFYALTCPNVGSIVRLTMTAAIVGENRGCDGSILLDDTATFTGEKNAVPNRGSLRGFEVIDTIKTRLEADCPGIVSCADILALAAREATNLLGGPTWTVPLGRRDARTADQNWLPCQVPTPLAFASALASETTSTNETISPPFAVNVRRNCPAIGGDTNLAPLDITTPNSFDNSYYRNILINQGLLHSDQELINATLTSQYASNPTLFANYFAAAMVRMGNISPLTGNNGEIRRNCRVIN